MKIGPLVGKGATAEVYELDEYRVLKLFYANFPEGYAREEYEYTQIVNACGVPSPKALEWVEHDQRAGIVYERIRGNIMPIDLFNPWKSRRQVEYFAALHYEIHGKKPFGLPTFKQVITSSIQRTGLLSDWEKKVVSEVLDALPDGDALCHGDFHMENIFLAKNKPFIIDWMDACIGDPAADVARTVMILTTSELPVSIPRSARAMIDLRRKSLTGEYVRQYCRLSGMTRAQIQAWETPILAARLAERRSDRENGLLLRRIRRKIK